MRTILFIIRKEFKQIFRNKTMLPVIFLLPVIQMVILAYAATNEIKNLDIAFVDNDYSQTSREIISKFQGSKFFNVNIITTSIDEANDALTADKTDAIIVLNSGFEEKLMRENSAKIQVIINAINGTVAGIANGYISSILVDVNKNILLDWYGVSVSNSAISQINIYTQYWFNPELNYQTYMVPGILVILVTVIGMFLSGLNLVREKEMGTIEQINVTPIKKYQFLIGKLIPFWIIALFELAFGLIIGKIIFDIPIVGNLGLLFFVAGLYLVLALSIGLLISTQAETQQQVMFVSFFFLLVFILMSGIFTPTESMPHWAQVINYANPFAYFMKDIRMILLKGSGFKDVLREILILGGYGFFMLTLAISRYHKTT